VPRPRTRARGPARLVPISELSLGCRRNAELTVTASKWSRLSGQQRGDPEVGFGAPGRVSPLPKSLLDYGTWHVSGTLLTRALPWGVLAQRIIEAAKRGERDPARLVEAALPWLFA
jgi:hypothetical protein